jgi:thiol-disulfide isomerase/thioredoxin
MSVPSSVVYAIGAVTLMDTALVLLLLKRHGDLARTVAERLGRRSRDPLPPGTELPAFSAQATSGARVEKADLAGAGGVLAFFGVGCATCRTQAPTLAALARADPGSGRSVLAVVSGEAEGAADLIAALGDAVPVVSEPFPGPLALSYRVERFPTFFEFDDQARITRVVHAVELLAGAAAPVGA